MKEVYIYTLSDSLNNHIRYIGKTININKRLQMHKDYARYNPSTHCGCWIKSILNSGGDIKIEVLDITTEDRWEIEESFYISYFRFLGFNLVNHTSGGKAGPKFKEFSVYRQAEIRNKYTPIPPSRKGMKMPKEALKKTLLNLKSKKTPVNQLTIDRTFIRRWSTMKEVLDVLKIQPANINKVINNKRTHAGGYKWELAYDI